VRPIGKVKLYPSIPRRKKETIEMVTACMTELAWRQPTVVDPDGVDSALPGFDDDEMRRLIDGLRPAETAEPPASVRVHVDQLNGVKEQREKGNAWVISKSDTEHYPVDVLPDSTLRENAVKRPSLRADERYGDGSSIELRERVGGERETEMRAGPMLTLL
jgi:hypothetical protein